MVNIFRWFCIFTVTFVFLFGQSTLAGGQPDVSRKPLSQLTKTPPPGDPYPEIEILPGFGSFIYNDDGDNAQRPVTVYYYRPDNFPTSDSKVIFTMHGSLRDAVSARDRIVPYADRYNALLIAPEFSIDYYPDADDYLRGFVKDGGGTGNLRARSDWTFLTIEELFDIVLAEIPGAPNRYSIQGNSGGGQFISRIPLIVPEARFEVAAGSNGGWYTLTMRDELYPNGIGDLDITDEQIEQAYSKKVVVTVGELDTDPNSYDLEHNEFTDRQGLNRYERALFYHDYMGNDAEARGVPYNWDLLVVENVGHPAELMAHATAGAVFSGATTPADEALSPNDDTYIDESNPSQVFGASLELRVDGGNQEIAFLKFDLSSVAAPVDVAMLKLYITNGSTGQQFVHEVSDNSWTESSLTWNNAPALGQEIGLTTGGEKDGILYVEVTDYINGKIGGLASLAFQSLDTDQLYFSSSEASYFPTRLVLFGVDKDFNHQLPDTSYQLIQNHPNPFHKHTDISYQLKAPSHASLKIYDITGKLVKTLVDKPQESGLHQLQIANNQLPSSGIYFARLLAKTGQEEGFSATKKMILIK